MHALISASAHIILAKLPEKSGNIDLSGRLCLDTNGYYKIFGLCVLFSFFGFSEGAFAQDATVEFLNNTRAILGLLGLIAGLAYGFKEHGIGGAMAWGLGGMFLGGSLGFVALIIGVIALPFIFWNKASDALWDVGKPSRTETNARARRTKNQSFSPVKPPGGSPTPADAPKKQSAQAKRLYGEKYK
jgi:hypothetical protein